MKSTAGHRDAAGSQDFERKSQIAMRQTPQKSKEKDPAIKSPRNAVSWTSSRVAERLSRIGSTFDLEARCSERETKRIEGHQKPPNGALTGFLSSPTGNPHYARAAKL